MLFSSGVLSFERQNELPQRLFVVVESRWQELRRAQVSATAMYEQVDAGSTNELAQIVSTSRNWSVVGDIQS